MKRAPSPSSRRSAFQLFLGRPEDPALHRATRVAVSVVLILLLGGALRSLGTWLGLVPDEFPLSWAGIGEEMVVKSAGAFVGVLFLHLLRWLIRARRRALALTLVAATGPLCFAAGLMSLGAARVFSMNALTSEALVAWLVLLLVPAIFLGVVIQLEPVWLRAHERSATQVDPPLA